MHAWGFWWPLSASVASYVSLYVCMYLHFPGKIFSNYSSRECRIMSFFLVHHLPCIIYLAFDAVFGGGWSLGNYYIIALKFFSVGKIIRADICNHACNLSTQVRSIKSVQTRPSLFLFGLISRFCLANGQSV